MQDVATVFSNSVSKRLLEVLVFEVFKTDGIITLSDISKYCNSRLYHGATRLPNALELLNWLEIIAIDGHQYGPAKNISTLHDGSLEMFSVHFGKLILGKLNEQELILKVFSAGSLSRDSKTNQLNVLPHYVNIDFQSIVVLLRNLALFHDGAAGTGLLIVDESIAEIILRYVLEAQKDAPQSKGKLSLEQLKRILELQEERGKAAEVLMLRYEKSRLATHTLVDMIRIISEENSAAGFDILSFESPASAAHDRFIEVKSYSQNTRFFWSINEYETALELGDNYYIYLVSSSDCFADDYQPMIIQNPAQYFTKHKDQWSFLPQSWLVEKLTIDTIISP